MSLVVASKLKELIKQHDMMMAGDLAEGASDALGAMLKQAVSRAKANGRKTVRREDL